ncbi:hypothetical protein NDU88_006254 [Pleurodeles waltl]|uniref:Uncharacterized protein n=1 Tax=Pleurodeles waltl TaxID=8319 RepID=A0AAV7RNB1_PLEWA|nr:hypothetical protein NDU88_006254 [Pleurodeles waltl]
MWPPGPSPFQTGPVISGPAPGSGPLPGPYRGSGTSQQAPQGRVTRPQVLVRPRGCTPASAPAQLSLLAGWAGPRMPPQATGKRPDPEPLGSTATLTFWGPDYPI